jgi:SAM-dependent methyltransferase
MTEPADTRASDCWGRLNEAADLTPILTILDALPDGFREARRAMIRHLNLQATSTVLEAGCGPGTAMADLSEFVGPGGRIIGLDPTKALVEQARARAKAAGIAHAAYDVGDIREIARPDASCDAAFCDKILVHVSPTSQAIGELTRVTRPGGRVGAVEWFSQGMMIAADYATTRQVLEGSAPAGALNPMAPLDLERHLAAARLTAIESGSVVAEARRFLPSLQIMLKRRVEQAESLGAITAEAGAGWLRELHDRDGRGEFYWAALVRWAVGTKAR